MVFSARRMADASSVGLLSYDPGGGHTDQLRDLSLALAIAELTNRRVVWPAYFHHRDVNVWTNRQVVARLARKRSRLSSIIEVVGSSVQLIEQPTTAHDFPRCDEDGENASCVVWVDPPEANASVSAALRSYAELQHAPWVHFHSLLDVLSARLARPKRYPITAWERELQPTGCFLQYRADVLATARRALRKQLGSRSRHRNRTYLAAHVRALRRRSTQKGQEQGRVRGRVGAEAAALRGVRPPRRLRGRVRRGVAVHCERQPPLGAAACAARPLPTSAPASPSSPRATRTRSGQPRCILTPS